MTVDLSAVNSLIDAGRYDEAEGLCERALAEDPAAAEFHAAYGNSLFARKQYDQAEHAYRQALSLRPEDPVVMTNLAGLLYEQGRYAECLRVCAKILSVKTDDASVYIHKGNALSASGRFDEALTSYDSAARLTPDEPLIYYNKATVYLKKEDYDAAAALLEKLLKESSDNDEYLEAYAVALEGNERFADAGRCRLTLLKHRPDDANRISLGGVIYSMRARGMEDEATALSDDWLAAFPDDPFAKHTVKVLSGGEGEKRASAAYVGALFDVFADSFDEVLEKLDYRAPDLIADAVVETGKDVGAFLDLGCGTGLCGKALQERHVSLRSATGVDLSEKMLEKADGRGFYTQLVCADILSYLPQHQKTFDTVVSGDVFTYLGDLSATVTGLSFVLKDGGRAVFSFTDNEQTADDFYLTPSGRYVHKKDYVDRLLRQAGFASETFKPAVLRQEMGLPVNGFIVIARR